ncbi:MAG: winged helix DNA-binding protein [Rikenellaceae bacterium]
METICAIREIYKAISEFEIKFEEINRISLNEAMVLCSLSEGRLSASEIAKRASMSASNTSKVVSSIEKKWLIERVVGKSDKRQMYFSLTKEGKSVISRMNCNSVELPEVLKRALSKSEAEL